MKRVVVTENIHPDAVAMLQEREDFQVELLQGDPAKLANALPAANAVLVRTMELPEDLLAVFRWRLQSMQIPPR